MNIYENENNFALTFLYGWQFYDICNYILNNEKEYEVQNIFKYITCGINLNFYSKVKSIFKEQNPIFNSYNFEDLDNFIFKLNKLSFEKIFEFYLISNEKVYFIWNLFL